MKDYFSKGVTKVQKIVLDYVDYYRSVKLHKKLTFDRQKVVIFVGAPRSGTTLVGYLLGLHPNALISIESRLIQNVVLNNHDYSSELLSSERYAILQHVLGVNNMRNRKVTSKFQAQWKSVDDSTLFESFRPAPEHTAPKGA